MDQCELCGSELIEVEDFGTKHLCCPEGCHPQIIADDFDDFITPDAHSDNSTTTVSIAYPTPISFETSHCWKCPGTVIRSPDMVDGPYLHFCPVCGVSLRYHPLFGEGKPRDLARRRKYSVYEGF